MDDVLNVGFTDLFEVYPIQQHSHTGVQYSYLEKRTTASGRVTFNSNSERLHLIKVSDPNLQLLQCALVKEHTWDHVGFCFRAHTTIREGYNYQARLITEVERVEPGLETLYKLSLERLPFITPSGHTSNSVMLVGWFVKWDEILDDRSASEVHNFNSLLSLLRGTENDASPFLFRGAASPGSHSIPAGVHLFVSRVFDIGKPDSNRPKNRAKQDSSLGITKSSSGRVSKHTAYSSKLTEGLLASQQAVQNGARSSPISANSAVPVKQQYTPPVLRPQSQQPASPKHSRESDVQQYAGYSKMLQQREQQHQQQQQQQQQQHKQREQQKQQQREEQQREQTMQQLCGRDALLQRSNSPYSQPLHTAQLYSHHSLPSGQLHHTSMGHPPAGYPGPEQMLSAHYPAAHALWSPALPEQLPPTLQHPVLHPLPSASTDAPSPTSIPSGNEGKASGATSSLTTSNSGGVNLPLNMTGRPTNSPASPIGQIEPYTSTSNSFSSYAGLQGDGSPHVRIDHHISHLEDAYLSHYSNGELDVEALVAQEVLLRQQQQHAHAGLHAGYMNGRASPALAGPLVPSEYVGYPSLKGTDLDTDGLYDAINPTFVNVRSVSRRAKSPLRTPDKKPTLDKQSPPPHCSTPPKMEPVSNAKPMISATYSPCISPPSKVVQQLPGGQCYHHVQAPGTPVVSPPPLNHQGVITAAGSPVMHAQSTVIGLPVGPSPGTVTYPSSPVPTSPPPMVVMSPLHYGLPLQGVAPGSCCTGTPVATQCASPVVQYMHQGLSPTCCGCVSPNPNLRASLDTVEDYKALDYPMPTPIGNPESDIDPADIPDGIGHPSSSDESIFTPTKGRYKFSLFPSPTSPPGGHARFLFSPQGPPRALSHDIMPKFNLGAMDPQTIKQTHPTGWILGKPNSLVGKLTPYTPATPADADSEVLSKYKPSNTSKPLPSSGYTIPITPRKPSQVPTEQQGDCDEDEFFDASEDPLSPGPDPDSERVARNVAQATANLVKAEKLEPLLDGSCGAIPASYEDCSLLGAPLQCDSPRWAGKKCVGEEEDWIPVDLLMCSAPDLHLALTKCVKSDTEDESAGAGPVLYEKLLEQAKDPFKPQRLVRSTSFASRISRLWTFNATRQPSDDPATDPAAEDPKPPRDSTPAPILRPSDAHTDSTKSPHEPPSLPPQHASSIKAETGLCPSGPVQTGSACTAALRPETTAVDAAKIRALRRSAARRQMLQDSGTMYNARVLGVDAVADGAAAVLQPTIVVPVKESPPKEAIGCGAAGDKGGVRAAVQALIHSEVVDKPCGPITRGPAVMNAVKNGRKGKGQNVPPTTVPHGGGTKKAMSTIRREPAAVCTGGGVLQAIENQ